MMSEQATSNDVCSAWSTITVDQFCGDAAAVADWRNFLNTDTGKKIAAVFRGADPIFALVTADASSPAMIRSASRLEGDASDNLIGKATAHKAIELLLFRRLTIPKDQSEPKSKRAGRREIPAASASIPTS